MKCFCIAFVMVAVVYCGRTSAASVGLGNLLGDSLVKTEDVAEPVNRVLVKSGLSKCDDTIKVSQYIGSCIPAELKCVGVGVLDTVTKQLVNIPACEPKAKTVVVQQQQQG